MRCQICGTIIDKKGLCENCKECKILTDISRDFWCSACSKKHQRSEKLNNWMNNLCCEHWEEKTESGLSLDNWLKEFRIKNNLND